MTHAHAPEGAGRYDHADPDEGKIDLEPYMAQALTDVVEIILSCGEYPQPRKHSAPSHCRRRLFDLREWANENIDQGEMAELYVSILTDFRIDHDARWHKESARVEAMLREELRDSNIVQDRAETLYEEAKEEA